MNDHQLKQTLHAIGREAVPDHWNRWEEIKQRAQAQNRRILPVPSRQFWMRRAVALLAVLLVSTSAIYAFVQVALPPPGDTGIAMVHQLGQTTALNLAHRIGDVEVQMHWGYADSGRLILNYQTFAVQGDGTRQPADLNVGFSAQIIEKSGLLPTLFPNRYENTPYGDAIDMAFNIPQQAGRDVELPDSLDLQFELMFERQPRVRNILERLFPFIVPASYYQFDWDSTTGKDSAFLSDAYGPFTFDFTLPVVHAFELTPMQTVTQNGVSMTVESVDVSPSKVDIYLCYRVHGVQETNWTPSFPTIFSVNGVANRSGGGEIPPYTAGEACANYYFEVYIPRPAEMTFTISALEYVPSDSPETMLEIQREMAARNIQMTVEINEDGSIGLYSWSNHTPESKAALVELGYRIEGPWSFTFEVPAPQR